MMMKKIYLLLSFILFTTICFAQKHDYVWTLGYDGSYPIWGGINLNFNKNPVDTDYVKRDINFRWNCTSICNKEGKLLFYTNGCKIFNQKHTLTLNGEGLNPGLVSDKYCKYGNLATQGSLFLPHPSDTSLYYLFHLHPEYTKKYNLGLITDKIYYTLLDVNGDNGNGAVLSKNNIIYEKDTLAFGKMTAVRHGNGRDWWIIVPIMLQNRYLKLLFTDKGIAGPFFQNIGPTNEDDDGTGQAVFSPDGTKYIHFDRYNDLNIFDFNRCTGELSNPKNFLLPTARDSITDGTSKYAVYTVGGVAVAPNSKFLYVTTETHVFQYDLTVKEIEKSVELVAEFDGFKHNNNPTRFFLPHIAPDHKIYISCTNSVAYLHVINNPDEKGESCNLTQHSFRLPTLNAFSTPNFPNFRLGVWKGSPCDTLKSIDVNEIYKDNVFIYPNPAHNELNIKFLGGDEGLKAECYDLQGHMIYQCHFQNQANINTTNWQRGLCAIVIRDTKGRLVKSDKVIIE